MGYKIPFFCWWTCSLAVPVSQYHLINSVLMKNSWLWSHRDQGLDSSHLILDICMRTLGKECRHSRLLQYSLQTDQHTSSFCGLSCPLTELPLSRQVSYKACYLGTKTKSLKWCSEHKPGPPAGAEGQRSTCAGGPDGREFSPWQSRLPAGLAMLVKHCRFLTCSERR